MTPLEWLSPQFRIARYTYKNYGKAFIKPREPKEVPVAQRGPGQS